MKHFILLTILISCRSASFCQSATSFNYDHELSSDTVFTCVHHGLEFFFLADSTFISSYNNDAYKSHYAFSEMIGAYSITSNGFILYPSKKEFLPVAATVKVLSDSLENDTLVTRGQINFIDSNSGLSFSHFLGEDDFSFFPYEWDDESNSYDLKQNDTLRFRVPLISQYLFELPLTAVYQQVFIEFTGLHLEKFNYVVKIDKKDVKYY